jgi:subtilisin family serine protease
MSHDHPGGYEDQRASHGNWWPNTIAHHGPGDGGPGHYHYVRDQLLVADRDLPRVQDRLERLGVGTRRESWEDRLGVVLLELDEQTTADDEHRHVPALVDQLHDGAAQEVVPRVAPNHVLGPCTHAHLAGTSPAQTHWQPEDVEWPAHVPLPGSGVTVGLLDTGVRADIPWFRGRVSGDPELERQDTSGRLLPNCGHGTFVAGMVLQHAPGAEVVVRGVFDQDGTNNDFDSALELLRLVDQGVDIVNMSIGAYSRRDRGMLAFERALDYVTFHRPDLVLIAAAGNDGLDRPCFPAADKRVIGVGAVDYTAGRWRRASFSDYGWWVGACAPGVDLQSTFLEYTGTVAGHHDEPSKDRHEFHADTNDPCGAATVEEVTKPETLEFHGTATWSGTSFSAPIVAAAIATEIAAGRTGPEAVRRVIGHPRHPRLHNLGTIVNPKRYVRSLEE